MTSTQHERVLPVAESECDMTFRCYLQIRLVSLTRLGCFRNCLVVFRTGATSGLMASDLQMETVEAELVPPAFALD